MFRRSRGIAAATTLIAALVALPATAHAQLSVPGIQLPDILPTLPPAPSLPVPTAEPQVVEPGETVTCTAAGATSYAWYRGTTKVADGATYEVTAADVPAITCVAVVSGVPLSSLPVAVLPLPEVPIAGEDPGLPPLNTAPPTVTGTAAVGRTVGCLPGTWIPGGGLTSFAYAWEVDAAPVAGASTNTYAIQAADAGRSVRCVVTGRNALGAATARSAPVVPTATAPAPGGTVAKPANTVAPALSGTPTVGRRLSCARGEWTGSPSVYLFRWARADRLIAGAEAASYTVKAADVKTQVRCVVVAGNRGGYGVALSRAVTPRAQADTTRPVISAFRFKPKRLVLRRGKGAFTWRLSEDARTTIVVERRAKGFKKGSRCVKVTQRLKKRVGAKRLKTRSCARWVRTGKLSKAGRAGKNRVAFKGKLRGRRLKAGAYRATATAKDAARNRSKQRRAKLKLAVRRGR